MPGICRGGSHGPGQRGQVCERCFPEPCRCPSLFRLLWAGHCQSLSSGTRTPANHCPRLGLAAPSHLSHNVYLVPGREAATTLVPCDLGMGLPCHHTAQIQGLPLSHCGGRGLDPDRWDGSWCCGDRGGGGGTCSVDEMARTADLEPAHPCLLRPRPCLGVW